MLKVELAANKAASSWDDVKHIVKVYGMQVGGNAHTGEIGTGSGFDLDDDAADVTLPVKRVIRIRETATSPDTILVRGRIADKDVARGNIPIGSARAFDVGLDDHNADLRGIPIRKWDRPRETDYQRVIALWREFLKGSPRASTRLAIKYRSGPMDGLGSVRNANRVTLAKKSYTDTDPYGVLSDIAESAGKEFFVTVDGELFYDLPVPPEEGTHRYRASLSITDDDPNMSTSFPPVYDVVGHHDGSEFLSRATHTWGEGHRVSAVREAVEDAHDLWGEVIPIDDVGSQADARERLRTLLSSQAREDRTYTVAIDLRDEQMWRIKYGQTVSFRAAGAGVLSPIVLRVGRLLWEPLAPGHYRAHMELGFPKKLVPRIRRGQKKRQMVTAGTTTGGAWVDLDTFSRTLSSETDFGRADNDRDEDRLWGGEIG